jgi:hypothetical protein
MRWRECGDVWLLRRGTHAAVCTLFTHPLGTEVRITLDGEILFTEAVRNGLALADLAPDCNNSLRRRGGTKKEAISD